MAKEQNTDVPMVWRILGPLIVIAILILVLFMCYGASSSLSTTKSAFHKVWNYVHLRCGLLYRKASSALSSRHSRMFLRPNEPNTLGIGLNNTQTVAIAHIHTQAVEESSRRFSTLPGNTIMADTTMIPFPGQSLKGPFVPLHLARQLPSVKLLPEEHVFNQNINKYRPLVAVAMKELLKPKLAQLSNSEEEDLCHCDGIQGVNSTIFGSFDSFHGLNKPEFSEASTTVDVHSRKGVTSLEKPISNSALKRKAISGATGLQGPLTRLKNYQPFKIFEASSHAGTSALYQIHREDSPNNGVIRSSPCPIPSWGSVEHPRIVVNQVPHVTEYPRLIAEYQDEATGK